MIAPEAINHIGIAVHSIEEVRDFYESTLGAVLEAAQEVPEQHVRVAFFRVGPPGAAVRLEILEPTDPTSPIAAFLAKRGPGIHHIAYTVSDIEGRLAELEASGVRLVDSVPRQGAHGMKIAFLHPKSSAGVLTELCEPVETS